MQKFVYTIFLVLVFYSCKKNTSSDCTDDQYAYEFYSSSKIDTTTNHIGLFFQIAPGNDLVFSYTHTGPDCKNIADEEYVDKLVFKVPANANSFFYENSQLPDALCLFIKYAFWTNGAHQITSGYVKGTKVSATKWDIDINVDIGGSAGRIIARKIFTGH